MSFKDNLLSWRWWLGMQKPATQLEPPPLKITAIIPAFNEEACIGATIEALLAQTYPLSAIIVIDDCSLDRTREIARSYLGVTVLRTPQNEGTKSKAQNLGLASVETELFVTVDADTVLLPNAIHEALRYFNDPQCEVVSGTVVPQKRDNFWERGRLVEYLYAAAIMKPAQNHHGLVVVASGCFSIFRTATVQRFGGFNKRTLAEDLDLTWEIQDEGGRIYFASKAICYVVDPNNKKQYVNQLDRWYRGFMQNLKVRRFNLFPHKRRMMFVVYGYMLWNIASVFFLPGLILALTGDVLTTVLYVIGITAVFGWLPALFMAWRFGHVRDALGGLIPFMILPYLNLYIYLRAFVLEIILGRKLNFWLKGH